MIRLSILLLALSVTADAPRIRCLEKAPNPVLFRSDVKAVANTESQKTAEGFTGMAEVVDCFDAMEYRYSGGRYVDEPIRFRLHRPRKVVSGRHYPLLVWFHGRGESGNDNFRQLAHMQSAIACLAGCNAGAFYLLAVQCPADNREWTVNISKEDGKGDATIIILREIMEAVIDEFPIDEERIAVYGLSSGGEAACEFVSETPQRFSALAFASAVPPGPLPTGMNIWAFCCDQDQDVSLDAVRDAVNTTNRANGSAHLTVIPSHDHDSWTLSLRDKKILSWLISQKRGGPLNTPPGWKVPERTFLTSFLLFGPPILCFVLLSIFVSRSRPCKRSEKTA